MKRILHTSGTILLAAALGLTVLTGCGASGATAASAAPAAESTTSAEATAETTPSESRLDAVKAAGKLIIGMEGTYPPFTYHDENGELTGMDVEVGKALAEKLGVEAEFQEASWDALLIGIDSGRFDTVINSVSVTAERAEKYDFSDPYYYEARHVVVRADDNSINTPDDLNGKTIATNSTNAFIPWYESHGASVVTVDTSSEGIDLVLTGRADFLGMNVPVLNAYFDEHPDAKSKLREAFVIPDSEDTIAIPVRKGDAEFKDAINEALSALRADGTLAAISEKYLGGDYTNSAYAQ